MRDINIPWAQTEIQIKPSGLRECVLRVDYLGLAGTRVLASALEHSLLHKVARWRVNNPDKFAHLLAAVKES